MASDQLVTESKWLRDRVRAKIRYARLLLQELHGLKSHGDDFDYAHEEGCLAHLDGVIDAFLQEVNVCQRLGLALRQVNFGSVRERLASTKIQCRELEELSSILNDDRSWLAQARELRNHQVHRAAASRAYVIVVGGGANNSKIQLRDPRSGKVHERDRLEVLQEWIDMTETLFERLGASLRAACGLPVY